MRRKRTSLRRWKARAALGRPIPYSAICDHRLSRWFMFIPIAGNRDFHFALWRWK